MPRWFGILSRLPMPTRLSAYSRSLRPYVSIGFFFSCSLQLYFCLEKLSPHSLHKRRHHHDALSFGSVVALNPALLAWKMFSCSYSQRGGPSQRLVFVPLINTVLLPRAPMLPTWWVKISTYLQLERFLSIIFYNLLPKIVNNI
jgi:hypothetical protein